MAFDSDRNLPDQLAELYGCPSSNNRIKSALMREVKAALGIHPKVTYFDYIVNHQMFEWHRQKLEGDGYIGAAFEG